MYAAAGGASIASRKARQNKALIKGGAKKPPPKAKGLVAKPEKPQSKQFHQLPESYHKHLESSLAPPSLHHSRSLTLRAGEDGGEGIRPSRSAHELPSEGLEPGVVGDSQYLQPVGSPPRAYNCTHWESKLAKPPENKIVAFGSNDLPYLSAVCEAALMIRSKQRLRRKERIRRGIKNELPSNVATKEIGPFPRYPPHSWCAQGKAAWQEAAAGAAVAAARRCSVPADGGSAGHRSKQNEAHLRWMKRNRIHDSSYGGSSSDEEDGVAIRAANAVGSLLYIGLGTVALGLVISFVGTGDKGFKTPELRYTGPALICAGLACCLFRILLCACPGRCCPRPRARVKEPAAERLLLSERRPPPPRKLSIGMTALTLQREASPPVPSPKTPIIETPPAPAPTPTPIVPLLVLSQPKMDARDSPIELITMDGSSFDISSISSSEMSVDDMTVIENAAETESRSKLSRTREPAHAKKVPTMTRTVTFADTPNIIAPPNEAPPPAAEIVLTPSNLARS